MPIYGLPINLRYIHKRVPVLVFSLAQTALQCVRLAVCSLNIIRLQLGPIVTGILQDTKFIFVDAMQFNIVTMQVKVYFGCCVCCLALVY